MVTDILTESKNSAKDRLIRSYGRIKSRKLSSHKNFLINDFFNNYKISLINDKHSPNHLEIGFGFGDFLFDHSKKNPHINFYGFEPHLNGIANLLSFLQNEPLKNLKISNHDIRQEIFNFPDNFFEKIYLLFPDPWPKLKHYKRRLINTEFLDNILAPKLIKNGKIIIATDHDSYKTWIFNQILQSQHFKWHAKDKESWQKFPDDWTLTKYQKKAIAEGRVPILIEIQKHDQ